MTAMLSFIVLVLLVISSSAQFVTLNSSLQESGRVLACPGEVVTYTCETNGTSLTWVVEPYVQEKDTRSFTAGNSSRGECKSLVGVPEAIRVLVNDAPNLVSDLILRPLGGLENTTVICQSDDGEKRLPYGLSVPPQAPQNVTITNADGFEGEKMQAVFIIAEWEPPSDDDIDFYRLVSYLDGVRQDEERIVNSTNAVVSYPSRSGIVNVTVQVYTVNKCGQNSNGSNNVTRSVDPRELENPRIRRAIGLGVGIPLFGLLVMAIIALICILVVRWHRLRTGKLRVTDIVTKHFGGPPQADGSGGASNMDDVAEHKAPLLKYEVVGVNKDGSVQIQIDYDEDAVKLAAKKLSQKRCKLIEKELSCIRS